MSSPLPRLLLACCLMALPPNADAGAQAPGPLHAFTHAGLTREYRLLVPPSAPARGARALVVLLHGCTQDAADIARGTRVAAHAEASGVVVLLPQQAAGAHPRGCWNWYEPAHQRADSGEAALLAALTRAVVDAEGVDPRRVHVAGMSAGAAMAVQLAALFPRLYASVAAHSGVPALVARSVQEGLGVMQGGAPDGAVAAARLRAALGDARPGTPLLVVHGAEDPLVRPAAGASLAAQWRAVHGDAAVTVRVIPGLGHAWSGGDASGSHTAPDAPPVTGDVLAFLLAHPRP